MNEIQLKVAELRKVKGVTQMQLADYLGVSFQSISKWENGISLPDITLLPKIAEYFKVSVDYLLGIENSCDSMYKPRNTNVSSHWNEKIEYLKSTREELWNDDYFKFLVQYVWELDAPCKIIDFGCGYGYIGLKLLPLLPSGSTYTGIDISNELIDEAREIFNDTSYTVEFKQVDVSDFSGNGIYDVAICQALLRHIPNPKEVLNNMISSVRKDGLVICIETNRPFEALGTMVNGLSYEPLNEIKSYSKLWNSELQNEGRDFSVGLKLPLLMSDLGLTNIDIRLNDKVSFLNRNQDDFDNKLERLKVSRGWLETDKTSNERNEEMLKNRGLDDDEIQLFDNVRNRTRDFILENQKDLSMTYLNGTLITFGKKI